MTLVVAQQLSCLRSHMDLRDLRLGRVISGSLGSRPRSDSREPVLHLTRFSISFVLALPCCGPVKLGAAPSGVERLWASQTAPAEFR